MTVAGSHNHFHPFDFDALYTEFRRHVPWLSRDKDDTWWFHWPSYDENLANIFYESIRSLHTDRAYLYYTYCWINGVWTRRFIDTDAERRYAQRARRRQVRPEHDVSRVLR
jgi:hypothetical protein